MGCRCFESGGQLHFSKLERTGSAVLRLILLGANCMLRGIIKFRARIVEANKELTFPSFDFNPNEPGVEKVEIEGTKGDEILTTVHITSIATPEAGVDIATKVHMVTLDRISFSHDLAIENGRITESQFSPTDPPPAGQIRITPGTEHMNFYTDAAKVRLGLPDITGLKAELEKPAPPGERNFRLFRSALQSGSPVEKFMHLYNILLMFFDDDQPGAQGRLDDFVRKERPGVSENVHPKFAGVYETVYTRLRNELGHHRQNVNLDQTKSEMTARLGELIDLTKRAIELHP
jgi:hypothetical protein